MKPPNRAFVPTPILALQAVARRSPLPSTRSSPLPRSSRFTLANRDRRRRPTAERLEGFKSSSPSPSSHTTLSARATGRHARSPIRPFRLANPTCSPQLPTSFSQSHARRGKLSPSPPLNTAPSPNPEPEASSELHKGKLTQPPQRHKRVADAKRGARGTFFLCSGFFVGWAGSGVRGLASGFAGVCCRVSRALQVLGWAWRRGATGTTIFTSLRVVGLAVAVRAKAGWIVRRACRAREPAIRGAEAGWAKSIVRPGPGPGPGRWTSLPAVNAGPTRCQASLCYVCRGCSCAGATWLHWWVSWAWRS